MSIGMVGAASWGMLQAQTSNAANVSLPKLAKASVPTANFKVNQTPVNDNLRMSYQLADQSTVQLEDKLTAKDVSN
jgi:hypothetical protein